MLLILYGGLAFLIGALPFSYYARQLTKDKPLFKLSSQDNKLTKTFFVVSPWLAFGLNALDIIKAWLLTAFALRLFGDYLSMTLVAGLVVLGQIYSPFLKFKGGTGIPVLLGTLWAFDWRIVLLAGLTYGTILIYFNYLQLSFVLTMAALPLLVFLVTKNIYLVVYAVGVFVLMVILHLSHIQNYLEKKEPTIKELFSQRNKSKEK